MYRLSVKLLIKFDTKLPSIPKTFVSRVGNVYQYFQFYRCYSKFSKHSKLLKIPKISYCGSVVELKNRLSQKLDIKENSSTVQKGASENCDISKGSVSSSGTDSNYRDENEDLFDNMNYDEITGGDEETLNNLKLLMLEVDVLRQDGFRVPKKLSTDNWKDLLNSRSRSQKRKLLDFLWTVEIRKINDKKKKEIKKLENEEKCAKLTEERENNKHITYGFQGNTIYLRVYDSTMNHFDNHRLVQAMLHGYNVVVDCGFDVNMTVVENKLCAKQLCYMFAENRLHRDPFNIHFCNMNRSSVQFKHLKKSIPTLDDPDFPMNISEDHYTQLFPKEKLVYLTPNCRNELKYFDPDDIYIIGAIVDRSNSEPLTMAKAKSEGIRMAHLPLDRYLDWELGTKSLTINQVLNILLDVRTTGDWNTALRHVPRRKIRKLGEPKQDLRRIKNRGTAFQPPSNYSKVRKLW